MGSFGNLKGLRFHRLGAREIILYALSLRILTVFLVRRWDMHLNGRLVLRESIGSVWCHGRPLIFILNYFLAIHTKYSSRYVS